MAEKNDKLYNETFTTPNGINVCIHANTQEEFDRKAQFVKAGMSACLDKSSNTAVDNNVILRSPVTSNIKARGAVAEEVQTLTASQCNTLIRAVKGTRAELLLALMLGGGLRREEACGLKWSDFQYNEWGQPLLGAVAINRANVFLRGNDHVITTELKSKAAYRSVPFMSWTLDILDDAYDNRTSEYVLCCKNGEPLTPSAFASIWGIIKARTARTPEEVGTADLRHPSVVRTIDFHVHPHQLRHTYITYLFENHFDLREVQYFAGHSTPEMTLRVYTHYNEVERLRDSTERVNRIDPFTPVRSYKGCKLN